MNENYPIERWLSYRNTNKDNTTNKLCIQCSLLVDVLKYLLFVRKIGLEFLPVVSNCFLCLLILKPSFWFPFRLFMIVFSKRFFWSNSFALNNNPLKYRSAEPKRNYQTYTPLYSPALATNLIAQWENIWLITSAHIVQYVWGVKSPFWINYSIYYLFYTLNPKHGVPQYR